MGDDVVNVFGGRLQEGEVGRLVTSSGGQHRCISVYPDNPTVRDLSGKSGAELAAATTQIDHHIDGTWTMPRQEPFVQRSVMCRML
jgi:hypothetical protein